MTLNHHRTFLALAGLSAALCACAHREPRTSSPDRPQAPVAGAQPSHPRQPSTPTRPPPSLPLPAQGEEAHAGRTYHYLRSNRDGSEPEHVYVHRSDATHLEVYKMRERCTNAALVTAELDRARGQARHLRGGRLQPSARREFFATLDYDPATHTIDAEVRLPDRTLRDAVVVGTEPWHLYDFDLASLTATLPDRPDWRAPFAFGLPLVLVAGDPADFLRDLGRADARFVREETHDGRPALRFDVDGPAFAGKGSPLWIDRADGHILEASWGIPNHAGYRDFRLRLLGIDDGGEAAWERLLRAHFEGCASD